MPDHWTSQQIALFVCSLLPRIPLSFCPLQEGLLVEFWWCFGTAASFTRGPEKPKRVHLVTLALQTALEAFQREKKEWNSVGEKEKSELLGSSPDRRTFSTGPPSSQETPPSCLTKVASPNYHTKGATRKAPLQKTPSREAHRRTPEK